MSEVENLFEAVGFELVAGVRAKPLFGDGAMLTSSSSKTGRGSLRTVIRTSN